MTGVEIIRNMKIFLSLVYCLLLVSLVSSERVFYDECGFDMPEYIENPPCGDDMQHGMKVLKDYQVSVHVFGWQRYTCLGRTITSLNQACYPKGGNMDLTVWFDKGYNQESFATALNATWVHGKKTVRTFHNQMGVRGIWMNFWPEPGPNEIRLIFEDDTEVSRAYFDFFVNVMNGYFDSGVAPDLLAAAKTNVVGVALYRQALDEINYPFKMWNGRKYASSPLFLHSVPCSWGSAIFGWHWKDYYKFFYARTQLPFYNFTEELGDLGSGFTKKNIGNAALYLPSCRCNTWAESWKRFFIDFMYGRGLTMIFPNEENLKGFSTTHAATGAHTGVYKTTKRNPRNTPLFNLTEHKFNRKYNETLFQLPVFDLHLKKWDTVVSLLEMGDAFLDGVSENGDEFDGIVSAWRLATPPIRPNDKFLLFEPQFGLYNQIRALFHSLAIARSLGRVLVLPDVVANNGHGPVVAREKIFNSEKLMRLSLGRVVSTEEYKNLVSSGIAQYPTKILELPLPIKQLTPVNLYFENFGIGNIPHEKIDPKAFTVFTHSSWLKWAASDVEKVQNDNTIAFHSTYGAWSDYKYPDKKWHDALEHATFQEAEWIHSFSETIVAEDEDLSNGYICAHIRRGDFKESCDAYDAEMAGPTPRSWVAKYYQKKIACWVDEAVVINQANILKTKMVAKYGQMVPLYASTNDMAFAEKVKAALKAQGIRFYTLDDMLEGRKKVMKAAHPVIDITLCSKAHTLILNQFSTFSRAIYKTAMWRNATISPYAGGRVMKNYNGTTAYTWIKPNTDGTAQSMNDMVLFLDQ